MDKKTRSFSFKPVADAEHAYEITLSDTVGGTCTIVFCGQDALHEAWVAVADFMAPDMNIRVI